MYHTFDSYYKQYPYEKEGEEFLNYLLCYQPKQPASSAEFFCYMIFAKYIYWDYQEKMMKPNDNKNFKLFENVKLMAEYLDISLKSAYQIYKHYSGACYVFFETHNYEGVPYRRRKLLYHLTDYRYEDFSDEP